MDTVGYKCLQINGLAATAYYFTEMNFECEVLHSGHYVFFLFCFVRDLAHFQTCLALRDVRDGAPESVDAGVEEIAAS